MAIAFRFTARTDVGLVRSRNEDSGYAGPHLLAVADGMGGHAGGNVASSLVLARLAPLDGDSHGADDALTLLAAAIAEGNKSLADTARADVSLAGMGTTLTAIMRAGANRLALVHIGDSRAYLLRDGVVTQITKDHSFVQSLVDEGRITQEEAEHHPQRSLITRVLTGDPGDEPDLSIREAKRGDRYLICSDGLSDYVARGTIVEVLSGGDPVEDTAKRLVDLALKSGAPDNVTCVIADVVDPATQPPTQPFIVGAVADRTAQQVSGSDDSPAKRAAALRREVTGSGGDAESGVILAEEDHGPTRWVRGLVTLITVLALAGGVFAGWDWTQRQLFVGEAAGMVAIYQGLHQEVGPVQLYSVKETTDVSIADLPDFSRQAVQAAISVPTEDAAYSKVTELRVEAEACRAKRAVGVACGSGPVTTTPTTPATGSGTGLATATSSGTLPTSGVTGGATISGGVPWPAGSAAATSGSSR